MYQVLEKLISFRARLARLEKKLLERDEFYLYQMNATPDLETMLSSDPDFKEWRALKFTEAELERRCKEAGL